MNAETQLAASTSETSDRPWLSVLIPVYNVEPYLEQCVESVVDQSDPDVEIILCDDVSTDGSLALAQRLSERFEGRIQIIRHRENRRLSATRNTLMETARGEYFWFVDSDDYLLPGAIKALKSVVEKHRPDLIGGNYRKRRLPKIAFSRRAGRLLTDRDEFVAGICRSRKMYAWLKIARRELWMRGLRFPDGKYFEDAAVTPRLALMAENFFHIRRALIEYRIRPGSVLSGITRTPDQFDVEKHKDLAHALDGIADVLDAESRDMPHSRFAISHFIAMEYVKIAARILRAGSDGCGGHNTKALIREFHDIMESASPYRFEVLSGKYLRKGMLVSYFKLKRGLSHGHIRSASPSR